MADKMFSKEEFLEAIKINEEELDALIKYHVITPAGVVDGITPYFNQKAIDTGLAVKQLLELGYSPKDVARIKRKIGLPGIKNDEETQQQRMLTVGELAKRIGTNPRTIKHWEEKGIIEPNSHSPGGFRLYHEHYVELCTLLQDLQNLGYTLDEIKVIADLVRDFLLIRKDYRAFAPEKVREKFAKMIEQINILNEKMKRVEDGIKRWRKIQKQHRKEIDAAMTMVEKQLKINDKKKGEARTLTMEKEPDPA